MKLEDRIAARMWENLAWAAEMSGEAAVVESKRVAPWELIQKLLLLPDEEFLRGVYPVLFGRPIDGPGLTAHLASLAGGIRRPALLKFLALSREATLARLDTSWLGKLDALTPEGLWAGVRRLLRLPDEPFLRGLYEVLLGRAADGEGLAAHLSSLAQGQSREDMVRDIASSPEAQQRRLDTSWLPRLDALTYDALNLAAKQADNRPRFARLLAIADRRRFVIAAYRVILERNPEPSEVAVQLRHLRLIPFLSRRLLLRRLCRAQKRTQATRPINWPRLYESALLAEDGARELTSCLEGLNATVEEQARRLTQLTAYVEQQGRVQEQLLRQLEQQGPILEQLVHQVAGDNS